MYHTLRESFKEIERLTTIYSEEMPKFNKALLIEKTNPIETMSIYFATLELARVIRGFLEQRKLFQRLSVFDDPFDKKEFNSVSSLWVFIEVVENEKDNFQGLIDIDFLKSKSRVLRLWQVDYEDILEKTEEAINDLSQRISIIEETWYNTNKYLTANNDDETNKKIFLDKKTMTMYKLIYVPEDSDINGNEVFKFKKIVYNEDTTTSLSEIRLNPENIRETIPEEMFLEHQLSEYYPEYFL